MQGGWFVSVVVCLKKTALLNVVSEIAAQLVLFLSQYFLNFTQPFLLCCCQPLLLLFCCGTTIFFSYPFLNIQDTAWSEITLATSSAHEEYLDILHNIFYDSTNAHNKDRYKPWMPHLSLAYDNPDNSVITLDRTIDMLANNPSLLQSGYRKVTGLSLWRTKGKMSEWEKLENISLI